MKRHSLLLALCSLPVLLSACHGPQSAALPTPAPALAPMDPQKVRDQQDMTWEDYRPIPGVDWADPALQPKRGFKMALVAVDFPDQPFVITLPKHSDLFGNPQIDPVPREKVPQFYADFYNKPSAVNHGHTINGYWMEQSRGQFGITQLEAFGPYRMPKHFWEYGLNEMGQNMATPTGERANGNLERDADAAWQADQGANISTNYRRPSGASSASTPATTKRASGRNSAK